MTRRGGIVLALWCALAPPLGAQAGRLTGVTRIEGLSVRPLVDDSVRLAVTIGDGLLRRAPDGSVVRCVTGDTVCRYRRLDDQATAVPVLQDLSASVWGFGRGLRLYARGRVRAVVAGDEAFWPRGNDRFDLMALYAELQRPSLRVRLGRQWKASSLGYFTFDGAGVLVRPVGGLTLEGYAGWSLEQGLFEPVTSEDILALETFAPGARSFTVGAQVTLRRAGRGGLVAQYHREIRTDRDGLSAERVGLDGDWRFGRTALRGQLLVDYATGEVNEGRVEIRPPALGPVSLMGYVRRHRPYFALWTIWDAFSPVGYDEAGVQGNMRRGRGLMIQGWGAARRYEDAGAQALFGTVRSNGWRLGTAVSVAPADAWTVRGRYQAQVGFGAARSDVDLRLERRMAGDAWLAASAGLFQPLRELRTDEGTVWFAGGDTGFRLSPRMQVTAALTAYRNGATGDVVGSAWTQLRGSLAFSWTMGTEPGLGIVAGGRRVP